MKSRLFSSIIAILLSISLIAPPVFLVAPQKVYALDAVTVVGDIVGWVQQTITANESIISAIKNTLIEIHTATSAAAATAQWINTFVLQPLAFVMSGNLMKLLTASVLSFVLGKTNGTGAPQFVQDLNGNLQRVGDIQANAFFVQFGRNSNSPFAAAITSSLRTNYLWNTSSAGFFAANRSTLAQYSPNQNAFLAGNWSQGGVGAWFALTTQTNNNPYTLYQASQSQLASVVGSAVSARLAEINWGQGFLSWCGVTDQATQNANSSATDYASCVDACNNASGGQTDACVAQCVNSYQSSTGTSGVAPGDACYNKDGTPGTIKTPASTIKATLDKVLGGTQDKLASIGQLANEVGGILGNVGTVLGTVNLAAQILGGPNSGGLFGMGQKSGTNNTTRLVQYQNTPTLGVTQSQVYQNATTLPVSGSDMSSRITQYESSWSTIRSAANSAGTSLTDLANFCTAAAVNSPNIASAATAQASAARSAITTQIAPVLAQSNTAAANITAARAMVAKVKSELDSGTESSLNAYSADLQMLQTMPPTASDVGNVMQEVQAFNTAQAIPAGSLAVSGGSIIDRMALVATNAVALKTSVCTEQQADSGGSNGGD